MYIIFNKDGSIKESQLNDYVNQYSDGVNFLDIVIYDKKPDDYTASATYTLPNGENLTDTGVYKNDIQTSLGTLPGYRFTLHSAETQYDGKLQFSLVATNADKTQLFTYAYSITINPSAGKKTTEVTWEEYQSLLAKFASFQLRFSSQNVIHAEETPDEEMLSDMATGQVILVDKSSDDPTDVDVYVVVADTTTTTGKKLVQATLGEDALKGAFVYKDDVTGEVQVVHTGLASHYTDKDDESIVVKYGTDELDVPSWFCYCLDGDTYAGSINMGAKTFAVYDAHSSDGPWLANDGSLTKIVGPSRNSKLELETGKASIVANNINIGDKLKMTDGGNSTEFTGTYITFGSGTYVSFEGRVKAETPKDVYDVTNKEYVDGKFSAIPVEVGSGANSIQTKGASATGEYSVAIGYGVKNSVAKSVAVGYNHTPRLTTMGSDYVFAVGGEASYSSPFGVSDKYIEMNRPVYLFEYGASGTMFTNYGKTLLTGDVECRANLSVYGTFTATTFKAINATSLDTERATIGLAKGNTETISTYIGLYATKYNGTDYGALVWDASGTAYVGDASVDANGKITDPNSSLQPLMTRARTEFLSDNAVLSWDAENLRAVPSTLFTYEQGNLSANVVSPNGANLIRVMNTGVGVYSGDVPTIFGNDGTLDVSHATTFEKDVSIATGKVLKTEQVANLSGNALVRYKETEKASVFGSSENKALIMGNSDRPYYSKDGSDFNGEELALKSEVDEHWDALMASMGIGRFAGATMFGTDWSLGYIVISDPLAKYYTNVNSFLSGAQFLNDWGGLNTLDIHFKDSKTFFQQDTFMPTTNMLSNIANKSVIYLPSFKSTNGANLCCVSKFTKALVEDGCEVYLSGAANTIFYACPNLVEIGAMDVSNVYVIGALIPDCPKVKTIHIKHFRVSFDISPSTAFEEADLVEIISNLDAVTSTQTLTMGATNLAKLTDAEKQVATDKGWTLA